MQKAGLTHSEQVARVKPRYKKLLRNIANPWLIRNLVTRIARNVCLDLKYGGYLGALSGEIKSRHLEIDAGHIANTDAIFLPWLFGAVPIRDDDVLVDVGCGRGRVINWWLDQGLKNQIVGVEIDERVGPATQRRLRGFANVRIDVANIFDRFPTEGTLFYMFYPFLSAAALRKWKQLLSERASTRTRIVYFNAQHVEVFRADPAWRLTAIPLPSRLSLQDVDAFLIQPAS
jgi:SAM-dependent methyltransferase